MNKYDPNIVHKRVEEKIQKNKEEIQVIAKQIQLIEKIDINNLSIHVLNDLENEKSKLKKKKEKLELQVDVFPFYVFEYKKIAVEYKKIADMNKPISFMNMKNSNQSYIEEKKKLYETLNTILKKYNYYEDIKETKEINNKKEVIQKNTQSQKTCECGNKNYIIDQTSEICETCGKENEIFDMSLSKDLSKFSLGSKYSYERRTHFRECLNQYQGKQNTTIRECVYKEIEKQLDRYKLLNESTDKKIRFQRVGKQHIILMLKELGITKHYEDYVLIYHNLTGKKIDDISHLENLLLEDFDMFVKEYDKKTMGSTERKSFINTRILLFQLLNRRKHPCKPEDFNILKTLERLYYHDEIIQDVFETLGWNYIKLF